MKSYLLVLSLATLFTASAAQAFPEMIRHGYVNCTTCHVSPSGGGLLTQYGRELSRDVMSTWGRDGEAAFAYGVVKTPEWLNLGGDYRHVYLYQNTPKIRQGGTIFMQADLEASVTIAQKWIVDGTFGYKDPSPGRPSPNATTADHLVSRRHYVNYRPTDELSFRAGRFAYNYGINMADHTTIVRGGLAGARTGLGINDELQETYNLEAAWIGEKTSTFVTGIFGRPDATDLVRETGVNLNSSIALAEKYKIGMSYLYASGDNGKRHVFGPYGLLGLTPALNLLAEFDMQGNRPAVAGVSTGNSQWGFADYLKLDYELFQGLHFFVTQELGRFDFNSDQTELKAYGLGTQFFPRPHFELTATWQKQSLPSFANSIDVAYLQAHYYF